MLSGSHAPVLFTRHCVSTHLAPRALRPLVAAAVAPPCARAANARSYKGVSGELKLVDSGKGTQLAIECKQGWRDTVIWNPYGDQGALCSAPPDA